MEDSVGLSDNLELPSSLDSLEANSIEYEEVNGIKIYTGASKEMRKLHERNIQLMKENATMNDDDRLFTNLVPSTLTAQGEMSNVIFEEKEIITMLSQPKGYIMMIGCNYGELYNAEYVPPVLTRKSGRGRKPKPKPKNKRKMQGTGRYFSSQVTFLIVHPKSGTYYKIKLFRNGVFQVPGVKEPSMLDLIEPVTILRDYLAYNFGEDVQVLNLMAVMRNYKVKLVNEILRVDLEELERYLNSIKKISHFRNYLQYTLLPFNPKCRTRALSHIGKTNIMNIAEITYNTDRCFSLIIKFYRPTTKVPYKKTTVKLLKRGKINFDGGNSEHEVEELYHWLLHIYNKLKRDILIDVNKISNTYVESDLVDLNPKNFIYDVEETESCNNTNVDLNADSKSNVDITNATDTSKLIKSHVKTITKKPKKLTTKQLFTRSKKILQNRNDENAGDLILKTLTSSDI